MSTATNHSNEILPDFTSNPAWGKVQLDPKGTIESWQEASGLTWTAETADVSFFIPDTRTDSIHSTGEYLSMPNKKALYRSDTKAPLSIVSKRYHPVQPAQVLEFFRDITGKLGAFEMDSAGQLAGGTKIWGLAKAKDEIVISKGDTIGRYLLLATSFDQSLPTVVQQMSTRFACMNQLATYKRKSKGKALLFKHITRFDGDLVKDRMMLEDDWKDFSKAVSAVSKKKVDDSKASKFFLDVFYPEEIRSTKLYSEKGAAKKVEDLMGIYRQAPGQELKGAKGTYWGLVNAVTYWADHAAKTRKDDTSNRLDKAWFGEGAIRKDRALELAVAAASN